MNTPWWLNPCKAVDREVQAAAAERQQQLTKPAGSLGQLETLAVQLAGLQGRLKPRVDQLWIAIFAGDHGVVEENISAYPQAVTRQMLQNFTTGGAAISVLAKYHEAHLQVIDCGTVGEIYEYAGVERHCIRAGTANFAKQAAMNADECRAALELGKNSVDTAKADGADIYIAGEMGIGNTCSASALACLLLNDTAEQLTGVGTGIGADQLRHKIEVIEKAIELHHKHVVGDVFKTLCAVGGLEIAAITGAYIRCAQVGLPIIVDGFISSVAALCAVRMNPKVRDWMLFGHQSAEYGHRRILQELNADPILKMNLRLGEGSGAGAALALVKMACVLHNQMATFAQAAVSGDKIG